MFRQILRAGNPGLWAKSWRALADLIPIGIKY